MRLHSDQTCTQCGKRLDPAEAVWLEMDSETHLYHAYGDPVPPARSQGGFPFGKACARGIVKRGGRLTHLHGEPFRY